jgi:uncharacterized protein (DUF1800 family)
MDIEANDCVGSFCVKPETNILGFYPRMDVVSILRFRDLFGCCRFTSGIALLCSAASACWAQSDPLLDLNGNGQGDVWERIFQARDLVADADADGDGMSNEEESVAGTDPFDANSVFKVKFDVRDPGIVRLTYSESNPKEYHVYFCDDLSEGNWTLLESFTSWQPFVFEDTISGRNGFYKVAVVDVDSDADGVTDWEELELGFDPTSNHTNRVTETDLQRIADGLAAENVVSLHRINSDVYESWPDPAVFVLRRSGGWDPIAVTLTFSGTVSGSDFSGFIDHPNDLPAQRTIQLLAGYTDTFLLYTPQLDALSEGSETLTLTLEPGVEYVLGESSSGTVTLHDGDEGLSPHEASRLLAQTTFGATASEIAVVQDLGIEGWLDAQMLLEPSLLQPMTEMINAIDVADETINFGYVEDQMGWWQNALESEDQLRQRVAFALSETLVVSDDDGRIWTHMAGISNYYDILVRNAFGNYRDILEEVTYHPVMGIYLSHRGNRIWDAELDRDADENYARELMQLFTVGLWMLNNDGTLLLDEIGEPIPSYTIFEIAELAKVMTGLNWGSNDPLQWSHFSSYAIGGGEDPYTIPMKTWEGRGLDAETGAWLPYQQTVDGELVEFYFHDREAKYLLNGVVLPANQTAGQDIAQALDALFEHPNAGPFLAYRLIQRLVSSNPSPEYVGRVASVFNDNGSGVRGDLGAVIKGILLDPEARGYAEMLDVYAGKRREPFLELVNLARTFKAYSTSGIYALYSWESTFQQQPLSAPTVFNFFEPGYTPAGPVQAAGLVAPEFQITNTVTAVRVPNHMYWATHGDIGNKPEPYDVFLDYSDELALADDPDALIEHLDLLLTYGALSSVQKSIIYNALKRRIDQGRAASEIVDLAVYLVMSSPDYIIQK